MDRAHRGRDKRNARSKTPKAELRPDLTPEAADALLAGDPFGAEPSRLPQRTVYFDTPRNRLAAAGLTLLVREMEGKRIQKVKAGGPAPATCLPGNCPLSATPRARGWFWAQGFRSS